MPLSQTTIQLILVALSIAGAILVALLGWAESGEDFDPRKFLSSVLRAILAGLLAVLMFQDVETLTVWVCVMAFLNGAGIDVLGHRAAGTLNKARSG